MEVGSFVEVERRKGCFFPATIRCMQGSDCTVEYCNTEPILCESVAVTTVRALQHNTTPPTHSQLDTHDIFESSACLSTIGTAVEVWTLCDDKEPLCWREGFVICVKGDLVMVSYGQVRETVERVRLRKPQRSLEHQEIQVLSKVPNLAPEGESSSRVIENPSLKALEMAQEIMRNHQTRLSEVEAEKVRLQQDEMLNKVQSKMSSFSHHIHFAVERALLGIVVGKKGRNLHLAREKSVEVLVDEERCTIHIFGNDLAEITAARQILEIVRKTLALSKSQRSILLSNHGAILKDVREKSKIRDLEMLRDRIEVLGRKVDVDIAIGIIMAALDGSTDQANASSESPRRISAKASLPRRRTNSFEKTSGATANESVLNGSLDEDIRNAGSPLKPLVEKSAFRGNLGDELDKDSPNRQTPTSSHRAGMLIRLAVSSPVSKSPQTADKIKPRNSPAVGNSSPARNHGLTHNDASSPSSPRRPDRLHNPLHAKRLTGVSDPLAQKARETSTKTEEITEASPKEGEGISNEPIKADDDLLVVSKEMTSNTSEEHITPSGSESCILKSHDTEEADNPSAL